MVGLTEQRGQMAFFVNDHHDEWSSFNRNIASRGHPVREILVETITTTDIFSAYGVPRYIKIDIEGYDHVPVLAIAKHSVRPKFVSFENGEMHLFEALVKTGYTKFQIINQALVPYAACPIPAKEGKTINNTFIIGSSGPFGLDLLGEWLSVDQMRIRLEEHLNVVGELSFYRLLV